MCAAGTHPAWVDHPRPGRGRGLFSRCGLAPSLRRRGRAPGSRGLSTCRQPDHMAPAGHGGMPLGGTRAAASHSTAAALLGLKGFGPDDIHVSGPKNGRRLPAWATFHRLPIPLRGVELVSSIPTSPPWRTLVDLGTVAPSTDVERALDDALRRRLVSLRQLRWAVQSNGRPRHRGTSVLRELLAVRGSGFVPPESELEALLYQIVDASDLPPARRQASIADRRCDLLFEAEGLVIEVDGWETHGSREAFEDDRARDRAMLGRGLRVLRFTWHDLTRRPEAVITEIRASLCQKPR